MNKDDFHKLWEKAAYATDPETCIEHLCQMLDTGWEGRINVGILVDYPFITEEFSGYKVLRQAVKKGKNGKKLVYRGDRTYLLEYHGRHDERDGTTPPWFQITEVV